MKQGLLKNRKSLRSTMEKTIVFSSLFGFAVILVAAGVLAFLNAKWDQQNQQQLIHRTISELITPPLKVSDYAEVRKVLSLVAQGNELTTVVTQDKDILLSDYDRLPAVQNILSSVEGELSCASLNKTLKTTFPSRFILSCTDIGLSHESGNQEVRFFEGTKPLATLISVTSNRFFNLVAAFFAPLLFIGLTAIAIILFLFRLAFAQKVVKPFETLVSRIRKQTENPLGDKSEKPELSNAPAEFQELEQDFHHLIEAARVAHEQGKTVEKNVALYQLSRAVAHDIRSPLAALNVEISEANSSLPDAAKKRLGLIASRIREIAEKLLAAHQVNNHSATRVEASPHSLEIFPLEILVTDILAEKNLEYGARGITVHFQSESEIPAPSALLERSQFKRVLSNLINNAVESMATAGAIQVFLRTRDSQVEIEIADSGRGIPPDILPRLMQEGMSFGKVDGNGLGLFQARQSVESWGGQLLIASQVGRGTQVTVLLPLRQAPDWLVTQLQVRSDQSIVVLDDDPTMHLFWGRKLAAFASHLISFTTASALVDWFKKDPRANRALFLFDYDLGLPPLNGIQLIEQLGLGSRATLVTGSVLDNALLNATQKLGIRILPKIFAPEVRVERVTPDERQAQVIPFSKNQTGGKP